MGLLAEKDPIFLPEGAAAPPSSRVKNDKRVFLTLTSQDFLRGSTNWPKASFFDAENDFVRRSSGKDEGLEDFDGSGGGLEVADKRDLMAATVGAEAAEGLPEEEGELFLSRVVRRSQRQERQAAGSAAAVTAEGESRRLRRCGVR